MTDMQEVASSLEGLAGAVAAQGQLIWAARLGGAAELLRETIGASMSRVDRAMFEHAIALARVQLDEKAFTIAWAEGRMMTLEQALAAHGKEMIPTPMPTRPTSATPVRSTTSPAGLTAREVEILRLVAQG